MIEMTAIAPTRRVEESPSSLETRFNSQVLRFPQSDVQVGGETMMVRKMDLLVGTIVELEDGTYRQLQKVEPNVGFTPPSENTPVLEVGGAPAKKALLTLLLEGRRSFAYVSFPKDQAQIQTKKQLL